MSPSNTINLLEAGEYMSGTMRTEDMQVMFNTIGELTECDTCKHEAHVIWTNLAILNQPDPCTCDYCNAKGHEWNAENQDILMVLFDHVNDKHTPEGHYFGAIEGDGACYGVWEVADYE